MKNLLVRAATGFQFGLTLLIQFWTETNAAYVVIWLASFVGWMLVIVWAFIEVNL